MKVGPHDDVITCPKRLYQKKYEILSNLAKEIWGQKTELAAGGNLSSLKSRAELTTNPAVAFGQSSGSEIAVNSNGQMSMDWVIQKYDNQRSLTPREYIGIEVQSIDITGNYRNNLTAYNQMKKTGHPSNSTIENSGHGLNWANVHKRLIPQIIRKSNIYRGSKNCVGFYFIVPEIVYQKFEQVIGPLPNLDGPSKDRLSIKTFSLGQETNDGEIRDVSPVRTMHFDALSVAQAFISNVDDTAASTLDARMQNIL